MNIALVANPHAAADIHAASRPLDTSQVPAVAAGTLAGRVADQADMAGMVAGMVVVVAHT